MTRSASHATGAEPLGAATVRAALSFAILTLWVTAIAAGAVFGGIAFLRVVAEDDATGLRLLAAVAGILIAAGVAAQGVLFWLPLGRSQVTGYRFFGIVFFAELLSENSRI